MPPKPAPAPLDPELLKTWTTAALVIYLSIYVYEGQRMTVLENAKLVGAELNARIPPRVLPA